MNLPFLHHPVKSRENESDNNLPVPVQEPAHNTNEGSEFLDDAIRMKEQPLIYTEETVATGSA